MGGYTKNIAIIRGLKSGFSVDGGPLTGLVKAEKYGNNLRVEVSLLNFAPLTQGKYVCAISDGARVCVMEGLTFDGACEVDTGEGFASLICFVNDTVAPVASAVCGQFGWAIDGICKEIERQENIKSGEAAANINYDDEALSEVNYYEYGKVDKDGGTVCENKEEEKDRKGVRKDEKNKSTFKEGKGGLAGGGDFYDRLKEEIENLLNTYPKEENLEGTVENSRWVKIDYGEGKYYVFGVIFGGGKARYICYGVPSKNPDYPPPSLQNCSFIPAHDGGNEGYWVMYQDAKTGASIKIDAT